MYFNVKKKKGEWGGGVLVVEIWCIYVYIHFIKMKHTNETPAALLPLPPLLCVTDL